MLHRFFDGQRVLHLVPFTVAAARTGWRIERNFRFDVFQRLNIGSFGRHLWGRRLACRGYLCVWQARGLRHDERRNDAGIGANGPENAALDKILKAAIAPSPLIVAPGGVKHAALAVRADPGPGLPAVALL